MDNIKIRCPKCNWVPNEFSSWSCTCGHVWNTFDTYGVCPRCGKRWEYTQCLKSPFSAACGKYSKHEDWYIIPLDIQKLLGEHVETKNLKP